MAATLPTTATTPSPTTQRASFAHESEIQVASLLDFYQIAWEYEPRTFVIETDAAGRATRRFTPDFYLPDHDLYIEITTVKPALAYRKNQKLRRLRERYPDIQIKLLSCKDIEALAIRGVGSAPEGAAVR